MKKKLALVGASMRCGGAFVAYLKKLPERFEIVGLFDIDRGKMQGFAEYFQVNCPHFTDFDQMCDAVQPDQVIITTIDATHAEYIIRALDRKIAVVSEKPLCINAEQCRDILAAQTRNREVPAVTSHNARYSPHARKVRELIQGGAIGRVRSVNYAEMLDLMHGTSYFRRWNSCKKNSGGLQIHKASHHFDELQWVLNSRAATVNATGALIAYGSRASEWHGEHCHSCQLACPFRVKYHEQKQSRMYQLFFAHATPGSYTPDRCIFSPEIDIEDFLSVGIKYQNEVMVNYSLIAHANYEGKTMIYEGEKGRLECRCQLYRTNCSGDDVHDAQVQDHTTITLCRYDHGEPEVIPYQTAAGAHAGADSRIFEDIFAENPPASLPTLEDGVQAVLVGAAINESLKTHGTVEVQSLL